MMKFTSILIVALLCFQLLHAQRPKGQSREVEWSTKEVPTEIARHFHHDRGFSKAILYTEANEAITAVKFTDKDFGLVKINSTGKVMWELRLMYSVAGLGFLNKQVIVFYRDEEEKNSQLHAALVDPVSGKKSLDKIVYDNRGETTVEYQVQNKNSGVFNNLMIRVTGDNGKQSYFGSGGTEKSLMSTKCTAMYFDENLSVVKTTELRTGSDYQFLAGLLAEDGTYYICSRTEDDLVVEQFDQQGQVSSRVMTDLPAKKKFGIYPTFNLDKINPNRVLGALMYKTKDNDEIIQLFAFDMKAKKVSRSAEEILNKAYSKDVSLTEVSGTRVTNLASYVEDLRPVEILQAGGKLIVLKEVRFVSLGEKSTKFINGPLVISFYDQDLKPIKHIGINKAYEIFSDYGRSLGFHIKGDDLEIITSTLTGVAAYSDIYCLVDTKTMSITKAGLLDKGELGRTITAEPNSTIWFPESMVVNFLLPKGFLRIKSVSTALQSYVY